MSVIEVVVNVNCEPKRKVLEVNWEILEQIGKQKLAELLLRNKNKQKAISVESDSVIFEGAWDILIEDDSDSAYHSECMMLYPTLVTDLENKSEMN